MKKITRNYTREFRRQTRMAVAAAVGFIIAYSWRDFIIGVSRDAIKAFTAQQSENLTNLYSSLIITALGVLVIIISSRLLREKK